MPGSARISVHNGAVELADFSSENDAELLVFMSMQDDDPAAAKEAWAEFYERHAEYLHAVCWNAYGTLLHGDTSVADLVADTFRRAFERAGQFVCDLTGDEDDVRRLVRAWLGRIAQRLAQDVLRGRARLKLQHFEPEIWDRIPAADAAVDPADPRVERVREALDQLNDREQLVIRVTFQWYRSGQEHQRLPNDVADELAATLRTTPENLRQIRRRALEKIRRYLAAPVKDDDKGRKNLPEMESNPFAPKVVAAPRGFRK